MIRVPGSANSPLTDVELAEVVDWILFTMGYKSLSDAFNPLTPEEVQTYREQPILSGAADLGCKSREIQANSKIPDPGEASAVTGPLHHNTGVRRSGRNFHRSPET